MKLFYTKISTKFEVVEVKNFETHKECIKYLTGKGFFEADGRYKNMDGLVAGIGAHYPEDPMRSALIFVNCDRNIRKAQYVR